MTKQGILFDFNGVIANDEHLHQQSMKEVVSRHGVTLSHELYKQLCLGKSDVLCIQNIQHTFAELSSIPIEQLVKEKVSTYRKLGESETILHPHILEMAKNFSQKYKMAIVTSALWAEVAPVLQNTGLLNYFVGIVSADDISQSKPNPEAYLKGIALLGLPAETIVAFEDTPVGVQAAKNAGLKCIAVEGTVSEDQLTHADKVVNDLSDITEEMIESI